MLAAIASIIMRKIGIVPVYPGLSLMLFLGYVAGLAALAQAQDIHIRALSASNGKPIANECLIVWSGTSKGAHLVAKTDRQGAAVLRLGQGELSTETGCAGWPTRALRPAGASGITLSGDRYIACQEYGDITPGEPSVNPVTTMPAYPIRKILESGISAGNTCGKFKAEAKPGELILFMRPLRWWERMKH